MAAFVLHLAAERPRRHWLRLSPRLPPSHPGSLRQRPAAAPPAQVVPSRAPEAAEGGRARRAPFRPGARPAAALSPAPPYSSPPESSDLPLPLPSRHFPLAGGHKVARAGKGGKASGPLPAPRWRQPSDPESERASGRSARRLHVPSPVPGLFVLLPTPLSAPTTQPTPSLLQIPVGR